MALYGSSRDISFFHVINKELMHNIIEQEVGYYQISLNGTQVNIYGEAKGGINMYFPPVLIVCLIDRGDYEGDYTPVGPDFSRTFSFRFLVKDLMEQNVVPQIGDVILWNNDYYKVNLINQNQQIVGKDPDYNYDAPYLADFGKSFSIICSANYQSPEALGITQSR
jgi:hypothetical protein